jgi:predicted dehydrogenase
MTTERRLRWGLLGTARINERLIPVLRQSPRCDLLAVASRSRDRADRYATAWHIPRAHGSYEDLLADPEIDVVYVGLPNALHVPWSLKAVEAGKHVLCEKPIALRAADVDRLAEAARRRGVVVQEAAMMRYHPQTRELAELIAGGVVGEVRLLRGVFTFTLARVGDIRLDAELGGGSVWDLGCYPVAFMRTMLGANPVEVQAWQVGSEGGVDLSFSGHLRFPGGAMAQFFSSFQATPHVGADILGSAGRIEFDLPWVNKTDVTAHVRVMRMTAARSAGTFGDSAVEEAEETRVYEDVNGYRCEVDALVAAVVDGAAPVVPLADSRDTVATVEALCRSAREDRPIPFPGRSMDSFGS